MPALSLTAALKVLILAGGISPAENHHSHLLHVEALRDTLVARGVPAADVAVFWADGTDPGPDRHIRQKDPPADAWLLSGTRLDVLTDPGPELVNTELPGARPATREALREWLAAEGPQLKPGDTLLLAVTDHGAPDPEGGTDSLINLWGEQATWSVRNVLDDLTAVPESVRVVLWTSQCFSGGFTDVRRRSGSCAAVSTTADRVAYGCFPELASRPDVGHFMHLLAGLVQHTAIGPASDAALLSDDAPDVPHRSSDALLFEALVKGAEAVGAPLETFIDDRLRLAAADDPAHALLARLCHRFGLGPLASYRQTMDVLAGLGDLRHRLESWRVLYQASMDAALQSVAVPVVQGVRDPKGAVARQKARDKALAEMRKRVAKDAGLERDLRNLEGRLSALARLMGRVELQEAAALRVAYVQARLAGPAALDAAGVRAHAELLACEAEPLLPAAPTTEPGAVALPGVRATAEAGLLAATPTAVGPLPPVSRLAVQAEALRPGWLGIEFRDLPGHKGVEVLSLRPASPARAVDLLPGDRILGLGGARLSRPDEFRRRVLLAAPGEPLTVDVQREKAAVSLTLHPAAAPVPPPPPEPGQVVPGFALDPIQAGDRLPAIGEGRPVLLFFWATWCKPCKEAIPALERFAQEQGAVVIAITREDQRTVSRFLAAEGAPRFPFAVARDPDGEAHRLFAVDQTPVFALIDAGRVLESWGAGYDGTLPIGPNPNGARPGKP